MKIPLVVLGGRDRRGSELPEGVEDRHPLHGYKGAVLRVGDRPLIRELTERLRGPGLFDPIYVAGPQEVYRDLLPDEVRIIDTDGDFAENLRRSLDATKVGDDYAPQIGFTTCDILPDPDELQAAADDLRHRAPVDFWFPQIRVPDDSHRLGESDWKPRYRMVPKGSGEAVPILPSHFIVAAPGGLRLEFVLRFLDILYATRNQPVPRRSARLTRALLWGLFVEDVKHVLGLQPPRIFFDVVVSALSVGRKLYRGTVTSGELERRCRRIFVINRHRKKYPERRGHVPVFDTLSLAKDIDTLEEARELSGEVSAG